MRRGLRNAADRAAKIAICVTAALFTGCGAAVHQYQFKLGWAYQSDQVPVRIAP
jgi:hypothetical protein